MKKDTHRELKGSSSNPYLEPQVLVLPDMSGNSKDPNVFNGGLQRNRSNRRIENQNIILRNGSLDSLESTEKQKTRGPNKKKKYKIKLNVNN